MTTNIIVLVIGMVIAYLAGRRKFPSRPSLSLTPTKKEAAKIYAIEEARSKAVTQDPSDAINEMIDQGKLP